MDGVRAAVQIALHAPFQRVRAARSGRRGMHLQGRRLAHGNQRVVLIEDIDLGWRGKIRRHVVFG